MPERNDELPPSESTDTGASAKAPRECLTLASLFPGLASINDALVKAFADAFRAQLQSVNEQFAKLVLDSAQSLIITRDRLAEHNKAYDDFIRHIGALGPVFREAGFWVCPSMTLELLNELWVMFDAGSLDAEALKVALCQFYREDNYEYLRSAVNGWRSHALFEPRMPIFEDALTAHMRGMYTLSVPALLPHVEGIASKSSGVYPYFNQSTGKAEKTTTAKIIQAALEKDRESSFYALATELALAYSQDMVYAQMPFHDVNVWLQTRNVSDSQILQRHGVLHGHLIHYASEENSLRAFLLLDALTMMG